MDIKTMKELHFKFKRKAGFPLNSQMIDYLIERAEQLNQQEVLKELEKTSEKMVNGWESTWTLKEIYQMILAMKKND